MRQRGLPYGFSDGGNRVTLGPPLLVRIVGSLRVVGQEAGRDSGRRDDVLRGNRRRGSAARPQKRGQTDREEQPATHQPILTCRQGAVNLHTGCSSRRANAIVPDETETIVHS